MLLSPVSAIATRDVITLDDQQPIHSAVRIMAEQGIHDPALFMRL